jgi:hypothetical protein
MGQRRAYHDHQHLSPLETDIAHRNTMDFLPKPKGSWKELNDKRQVLNNAALAIGTFIIATGLFGVNNFF